ncbi:MAG: hypothetical protein QNJ82_14585 [Gammaproteobacteria bacterium]|nr:hypothetical protein [Gammaproteobacteria bacterium]
MKTLLTAWSSVILAFELTSLGVQTESSGEGTDDYRFSPARVYPNAWVDFLVDLPAPPPTVLLEKFACLRGT